ncbi:hypothetical protein [Phormidium sp. FACHB-1136]|nr:hypothetical protein [Phormidium sp. FACHB-1136]MBD2429049.1 hypothetical protein [Phormidium sp. FACHB-1136]
MATLVKASPGLRGLKVYSIPSTYRGGHQPESWGVNVDAVARDRPLSS